MAEYASLEKYLLYSETCSDYPYAMHLVADCSGKIQIAVINPIVQQRAAAGYTHFVAENVCVEKNLKKSKLH